MKLYDAEVWYECESRNGDGWRLITLTVAAENRKQAFLKLRQSYSTEQVTKLSERKND